MDRFSQILLPDDGQDATAIMLLDKAGFVDWFAALPDARRQAADAQGFKGDAGQRAWLPGDTGNGGPMFAGGVEDTNALDSWSLAGLAQNLPAGRYRLANGQAGAALHGWLLGHYRFDAYRSSDDDCEIIKGPRVLLTADVARITEAVRVAEAVALVRDMVSTPAADMGPEQIEAAVAAVAAAHDATMTVTRGDALEEGFPLIHAVGRAAARDYAPRLIVLDWGKADAPLLAIVGKGVSFDSGGLDIKPASGMRLMKKDMGGAAHALALAQLIMAARLPVRLQLLVPAVENAISGNAFRPGDVVTSRKGLTVEIDNTDAEGRLVLADALALAVESAPDAIIDFATLTGAARVALGPDLPALFSNDDRLADAILAAGVAHDDPVWRLPLHGAYEKMLKSSIADTVNSSANGFAGAITAALFLRKFVPDGVAWAHLDTYSWRATALPGRPEGGEALGLLAAYGAFKTRYTVA